MKKIINSCINEEEFFWNINNYNPEYGVIAMSGY